jgi:hypothetical protein
MAAAVVFFVGRIYYVSTDFVCIKFVRYNIHFAPLPICNFLLINKNSYRYAYDQVPYIMPTSNDCHQTES